MAFNRSNQWSFERLVCYYLFTTDTACSFLISSSPIMMIFLCNYFSHFFFSHFIILSFFLFKIERMIYFINTKTTNSINRKGIDYFKLLSSYCSL